jgi:hypothetical protein
MESKNSPSREDIQTIIKEIMALSIPEDMQRKIMLFQHALSSVRCQLDPELWAILQGELGFSLLDNNQGNLSDNIEKAIEHYNNAFEVRMQKDFPMD